MSLDPTPVELLALRLVETQLAEKGVASGSRGYDLDTLAGAIYALGGAYSIDRFGDSYFAVIRPQQPTRTIPRSEGVGWNAESALVFAVVQAMQQVSFAAVAESAESNAEVT